MKYILLILTVLFIGCANDTGMNVTEEYEEPIKYSSTYSSSSFVWFNSTMSSSSNEQIKSYFMTDLEYVGIFKHSTGANLVMKNNTKYKMAVSVNYSIFCKVNNKNDYSATKTLTFTMEMYEQKESTSSIDGYWHGGLDTIECSGTINSIIPTSYDKSNFQPWSGNFDIKTN